MDMYEAVAKKQVENIKEQAEHELSNGVPSGIVAQQLSDMFAEALEKVSRLEDKVYELEMELNDLRMDHPTDGEEK